MNQFEVQLKQEEVFSGGVIQIKWTFSAHSHPQKKKKKRNFKWKLNEGVQRDCELPRPRLEIALNKSAFLQFHHQTHLNTIIEWKSHHRFHRFNCFAFMLSFLIELSNAIYFLFSFLIWLRRRRKKKEKGSFWRRTKREIAEKLVEFCWAQQKMWNSCIDCKSLSNCFKWKKA